jgi:hypothetical protein
MRHAPKRQIVEKVQLETKHIEALPPRCHLIQHDDVI